MVQFECPLHSNPSVLLRLGEFHFLIFLGNKGNGLWVMKGKIMKNVRTKLAKGLQMVLFECSGVGKPWVSCHFEAYCKRSPFSCFQTAFGAASHRHAVR